LRRGSLRTKGKIAFWGLKAPNALCSVVLSRCKYLKSGRKGLLVAKLARKAMLVGFGCFNLIEFFSIILILNIICEKRKKISLNISKCDQKK